MCTAVISIEPGSAVPVLLVGVRDEFAGRPWRSPGFHWPDRPGLLGGQDLRAGGTWLAVDPALHRASCVLNGFGKHAPAATRRSRGELPLLAAGGEQLGDPEGYDPFHLVRAEASGVRMWSWNGLELTERELDPGLHIVVNTGLDGAGQDMLAPPAAVADMAARLAYFRPRLHAARRPEPRDGVVEAAWGDWLPLVGGDDLAPEDPRALVVRRDFGDAGVWGSSSISLVALRPGGVRYDFAAVPSPAGAPAWERVA